MFRSVLQVAGLLLGCVGLGLFIALGIYAWTLKAEVNQQAASLTVRANGVGDEADKAIEIMRQVIQTANADLNHTRKYAADQPTQQPSFVERTIARKASQQLAGSVEQAHVAVITASDAVKVAEAAIHVLGGNEGLMKLIGVQPSQINATQNALDNVSGDLRQAKNVLGGPPTPEQLTAVDGALRQAQGFTDQLSSVVSNTRIRVNDTRAAVDRWSLRIAIAASVIGALGAIGQFFLIRYCWRTLRGLPA